MANQSEIVLDVKINTQEVATRLAAATKALAEHKQQQKELKKAMEESNGTNAVAAKMYAEVSAQIEKESREVKSSTALLQAETMARLDDNASLDEQRQALNAAQKAYAQLSGAAKEAADAEGGLRDQINALSEQVKEQEAALGDYRRNVGNYEGALTGAFDKIGNAAQQLGPAKDVLGKFGPEGQKAAAAIDLLAKVMTLASKYGKVMAATQKAQTAATAAQTGAQYGLNAAMEANPIGIIIAAITALISIAKKLISIFNDASSETEKFNKALEANNELIEQGQKIADFEAKKAAATGASMAEQIAIRKKAAEDAVALADAEVKKLQEIQKNGTRKERKAAEENMQAALDKQKEVYDNLRELNEQATIQDAADRYKAEQERQKEEENNHKKRLERRKQQLDELRKQEQKAAEELAAQRAEMLKRTRTTYENEIAALEEKEQKELEIVGLTEEESLAIQEYYRQQRVAVYQKEIDDREKAAAEALEQAKAKADEFNEFLNEDEEEEYIPTPDEMARDMFGLDAEGVEYFRSLLEEGVSISEAKTKAIADQTQRMTRSFAQSFGQLGNAFSQMADTLGDFSEENEEAAKAQKAFALTGIILNQAQSISEGALAIAKGVESAAGLPFPANIPAIISIVAQVGAMIAGVMSSISQAKQIFQQANQQKFATGGIVGGTSYTGDQVNARLNSREMVLNTQQQTRLFDAINGQGDGSLGINYEMMAAAMAAQPAPVVVYKELQEFGEKVSTFEEIASI